MIVPITSNATSYTADNSVIISSDIHDLYNNYFKKSDTYLYFPYSCYYDSYYSRTCYFGINQNNEYLKVDYVTSGNSYTRRITTGTDDNFSVNGNNVIRKEVSIDYVLVVAIGFIFVIKIVNLLLGGGYRVK